MRRRRVLSFVLACFIICSIISGPAFASGIFDLDEMGIDPWGDMDQLPDVLPGLPNVPDAEAGEEEQESEPESEPEEWAGADDGISAASIVDNSSSMQIKFNGQIKFYVKSQGSASWTVYFPSSSGLTYSPSPSSGSFTYNFGNAVTSGTNVSYSQVTLPANFYMDVVVSDAQKKSLPEVFGQVTVKLTLISTYAIYPVSASLLINGALVGDKVAGSLGTFNFDYTASDEIAISSYGYRFYFTESASSVMNVGTVTYLSPIINMTDGVDWSFGQVDPSIPLLGSIIEFLQSIVSGIKNIGTGIIELPGKIVTALIDGLKSLFIPSESDITSITGQYEALFSERLGFVYQAYSWVIDFASELLAALKSTDDYSFVFPGVSLPVQGVEYTFIPETAVDLDNALMSTLRPVLGTIVAFVSVAAFVNMSFSMVTALISGVSYFDFLKAGKGGGDGG